MLTPTVEAAAEAQDVKSDVPTALYRHFDSSGALLYVGISLSAINRLSQHMDASHWSEQITRVSIEWLPSRKAALEAEELAITAENPLHNLKRPKPPRDRLERYQMALAYSQMVLTKRVAKFEPLYELSEAASVLGTSVRVLLTLIESKELGCVQLPNRAGVLKKKVTGWQLIDFLESKVGESC